MPMSAKELRRLLEDGVITDVYKADRAYAILKVIGDHAEAINGADGNFGELFGVLQGHAQTEALLAVARLFDRPSKHHATRCLDALLDELGADSEGLPPIIEKAGLADELARQGMSQDELVALKASSDAEATRAMVAFLRGRLDEIDVRDAIKELKEVRNKRIAHNEARSVVGPTWDAVLHLLSVAKDIVGAVGWAFLSVVYKHEGGYTLSPDAARPSSALRRALEGLGIIEPRFGRRPRARPSED